MTEKNMAEIIQFQPRPIERPRRTDGQSGKVIPWGRKDDDTLSAEEEAGLARLIDQTLKGAEE